MGWVPCLDLENRMTTVNPDNLSARALVPPLLTPRFALLLFNAGIFGLAFSTYFLLPKFLAVELAADAATIGSVTSIAWLASVFVVPIVGVQIDHHGRKYFGCLGATIFAFACLGYLWVSAVGPLLWILRLCQGLSFTLFFVSMSTLATDISPAERLGQAIGVFGAVMISTNAIGPALAEWGAQQYGWPTIFAATACCAGLAAILTLFVPEQHKKHDQAERTSMLQVITRPGLRRILLVATMTGWTFAAVFTFYQPWALELGFEQVSSFLITYALCAMVSRIGLGGMADRLGRLRVAKAALLLYVSVPFALIWLDVIGLTLTGALLGLAHGVFFPALNALAVDYAQDGERGKAMASFNGAFNVGFFSGSFLLGYVVLATNYPTIFVIAGASCFAAFVVLSSTPKMAAGKTREPSEAAHKRSSE